MNDYYTSPSDIAAATKARSVDINTLDASVDAAFDKLPSLALMFSGNTTFAVDVGGQNALSFPVPIAVKALADGMQFRVKLANTLNGPAVATAGALGTFPVRRQDGTSMAGEVLAGQVATMTYLGGVFYINVGNIIPVAANGLPITGGTMTGPLNGAKGVAIASAAALDLQSATGNLVHVTGNVTITSVVLAPGASREVIFDGILTLTQSAALSLPGAANIITQAGDRVTFYGDTLGNVIVTKYQRADGSLLATKQGLIPIGAMLAFDGDVQGNVFTATTGETYLKSGVVADATAYPLANSGPWASVGAGTPVANATAANISNIAAGNGIYVASTLSGTVQTSKDGWEWTNSNVSFGSTINQTTNVAFANGYFILATYGFIYRSADGLNWTKVATTLNGAAFTPVYGNGRWVVMYGAQNTFYTSDDNGLTWTSRNLGFSAPSNSFYIANSLWSGTLFVIFGGATSYVTSPDGITWANRTGPNTITNIAYGNGMYVLCSPSTSSATLAWYSSPDAITWTSRNSGTSATMQTWAPSVLYMFGKFIIGDVAGVTLYSTNGTAWAASSGPQGLSLTPPQGVTLSLDGTFGVGWCGNTQFARLASNGLAWMAVSNGMASAAISNSTGVTPYVFEWVGDRFMFGCLNGSTPYLDYSWDGKLWYRMFNPPGTVTPYAFAALGGYFFVFPTSGSYYYSPDGYSWTAQAAPPIGVGAGAVTVAGNKMFMFTGYNTSAAWSANGFGWNTITMPVSSMRRVVYGNGVYLAFGATQTAYATSIDGANWTAQTMPVYPYPVTPFSPANVVFANGYFVMAGTAGQIYKSADGVNWIQLTNYVYGGALSAITGVVASGSAVVFTSSTESGVIVWNGSANDGLYRRGAPGPIKAASAALGPRASPAGLFSVKDGASTTYSYGQISAVAKVLNDYNIKTYDAGNVARSDFYKRVA